MNTRQIILVALGILLVGAVAVWWYLGFSLSFMRFFAAEPGVTGPADGTGQAMVACSPAVQTMTANSGGAQLTAVGGAGGYQWFAPDGIIATDDSSGGSAPTAQFLVGYTTPGTKKVTVLARRGDGSANVDSVACTVIVTGQEAR